MENELTFFLKDTHTHTNSSAAIHYVSLLLWAALNALYKMSWCVIIPSTGFFMYWKVTAVIQQLMLTWILLDPHSLEINWKQTLVFWVCPGSNTCLFCVVCVQTILLFTLCAYCTVLDIILTEKEKMGALKQSLCSWVDIPEKKKRIKWAKNVTECKTGRDREGEREGDRLKMDIIESEKYGERQREGGRIEVCSQNIKLVFLKTQEE